MCSQLDQQLWQRVHLDAVKRFAPHAFSCVFQCDIIMYMYVNFIGSPLVYVNLFNPDQRIFL